MGPFSDPFALQFCLLGNQASALPAAALDTALLPCMEPELPLGPAVLGDLLFPLPLLVIQIREATPWSVE